MTWPIEPPVAPMLSRAATQIPRGSQWRYEPKWDGFRAIVFRDEQTVRIDSRNARTLDRYFPELIQPILAATPSRCVADGEIVLAGPSGLDFGALQQRIHPAASRIALLAIQTPATFVAFDLLHDGRADIRELG
ncbi:MAG: ATP-dependent DNA ligase, partial [Actinomycetota bacterium]